jgi:hypothetical protein
MNRFTWIVVAGVLGLVVGALAVATVRPRDQAPPDLSTASGVVLAYCLAEQRGDAQAAWNLVAASAQARSDRDRFTARVGSGGTDRELLTTEDEHVDADTATVVLVRTSPGSGGIFGNTTYTTRSTVPLVRQDGNWRITVPPDDYLFFDSRP